MNKTPQSPVRTPREHAEFIKAWADGALIEWLNPATSCWEEIVSPVWKEVSTYRIKSEPKSPGQLLYESIIASNGGSAQWSGLSMSTKRHYTDVASRFIVLMKAYKNGM